MQYMKNEYLEFVPGKMVGKGEYPNFIFVFCHKRNNRIYKKKNWHIGTIGIHPKTNTYSFSPVEDNAYGFNCLMKISSFLRQLETKEIIFDPEKGELKPCM